MRKAGIVFAIAIPALSLAYYLWLRATVGEIFFVGYRELTCAWGTALLIGYGLLFPIIFIKRKLAVLGIVMFILTTIFLCLGGICSIYLPFAYHEAQLGNNTYYLLEYDEFSDAKVIQYLVECEGNSILCHTVSPSFNLSGSVSWPVELIPDEQANELQVFIRGIWVYTYGENSREYTWEDSEFLGDQAYELSWYESGGDKTFVVSKCQTETKVSCEILPFHHTTSAEVSGVLILDKDSSELYISLDGKLYSMLGEEIARRTIK